MRIISKFRDYYDTAMGYGIDKTIIYVRNEKEWEPKDTGDKIVLTDLIGKLEQIMPHGRFPGFDFHLYNILLGFCGKLYPLYIIEEEPITICPTIKGVVDSILLRLKSKKDKANFIERFINSKRDVFNIYRPDPIQNNLRKFENKVENTNAIPAFFLLKSPIFYWSNYNTIDIAGNVVKKAKTIYTNVCLKELNFQKIMNPYVALQELSMFIGGVLGNIEQPPQITDDKVLRDSKGFDNMSFKQKSPGKKANRAKNKANKRRSS